MLNWMNLPIPNPHHHEILRTPFGIFDTEIKGHIVLNKKFKFYKIMIFEMFNGNLSGYFRGENDKYPSFLTSYQKLKTNFDKTIATLQKIEFINWFITTPYYKYFAYESEFAPDPYTPIGEGYKFCFDFEAIAQHYEFATNYLDITTNPDIAEFFAYTQKIDDKYVPIENFNNRQPCLYSSFNSTLENPYNQDVRIVGFQTLLRPLRQQAMAINLENCKTNYKTEMIYTELPCDKKRAFAIYDKMEGGNFLMPDDYAGKIANIIKSKYKNEKIINYKAFEKYCKDFKINPKKLNKQLKNRGYIISCDSIQNTQKMNVEMKNDLNKNIIPWINEFVSYSPSF